MEICCKVDKIDGFQTSAGNSTNAVTDVAEIELESYAIVDLDHGLDKQQKDRHTRGPRAHN